MTPILSSLATAVRIASAAAFKAADPSTKLDPQGHLLMLASNKVGDRDISNIIDDGSGYIRKASIMYRPRGNDKGSTTNSCDVTPYGGKKFMEINSLFYRQKGIFIEDNIIAMLPKEELNIQQTTAQVVAENPLSMRMVGTPPTGVYQELWNTILSEMPGLIDGMDEDLVSLQAANFGRHISTGSAAAKTINFPLNGTNNDLAQGFTGFENDMMQNGVNPRGIQMVGTGLMNNYILQQRAKSADQAGLDTSRLLTPGWNYDLNTPALWGGPNRVGVFEKGSVQFVNACVYRGPKAGMHGNSNFFTLRIPYNDYLGNNLGAFLEFDAQLKYLDCPQMLQIGPFVSGTNEPQLVGRGYMLILSANYTQVNIPNDAYNTGDRLFGTNGTYLYNVTNT